MYFVMNMTEKEDYILKEAAQALRKQAGLELHVIYENAQCKNIKADAFVRVANLKDMIPIEIKLHVRENNIPVIAKQMQAGGILVTEFIDRHLAGVLQDNNIQFIDIAGNAYIDKPGLFVKVTGNPKKQKEITFPDNHHRAFEYAGLKVIFALVRDPELIQKPYRKIAEAAGVANGAVTWVIKGLKETGFMGETDDGDRWLRDIPKLVERWAEAYPLKLQPKLKMTTFQTEDPFWWKGVDIGEFKALWGGEVAAYYLTDYLQPEVITIFIPEEYRNLLLKKYRLRTAKNGIADANNTLIHVYEPFWPGTKEVFFDARCVDPMLVYAELLASKDPRNHETAGMIYAKFFVEVD
ncbi:MAG: hypothetical protein ACJAS1_004358 [Oleiphilaceae bacterium]|jgi:hypothetical protein